MPNLLRKGAQMLSKQMAASAADRLEYRRGTAVIRITPTRGQTTVEAEDANGIIVQARFDDFIVPIEQLKVNGTPFEPQPGHLIIDRTGATPVAFEVCNLPNDPCWRHSDGNRTRIRIHARQRAI